MCPFLAFLAAAALPAGAVAQPPAEPAPESSPKPVTERDASAVDVVTTPANDLNLRKNEIPQLLLDAQANPYGLAGLKRCNQISAAVTALDGVLGEDIDLPQVENRKIKVGKTAQSVIGSFIPFRGLIREVSGANEQQRRLQSAIYAGTARRSFLKGVGLQRGCQWPARPATPQMVAEVEARLQAEAQRAAAEKDKKHR